MMVLVIGLYLVVLVYNLVKIAASNTQGLGLFTTVTIQEGYVLGIIQGPITITPTDNAIEPKPGLYIEVEEPWVYINHHCNPNVELLGERVLVTTRQIFEGEELYLNYSNFIYDKWQMICACGHNKCRGIIHAR